MAIITNSGKELLAKIDRRTELIEIPITKRCCQTCKFEFYNGSPENGCPIVDNDDFPSTVFAEIIPYLGKITMIIGCEAWNEK